MTDARFTRKEVSEKDKKQPVFIIDNYVYDVSKFMDEHPGGHEVLMNAAGRDASEDFSDVGHSLDAKDLMLKYRIGELVDEDKVEVDTRQVNWEQAKVDTESGFLSSWKFPLLLSVVVTILYTYLFN